MKISLITVTYNSGKTLKDTIESVLHQTYKDVEYIIVDGHSKDNTVQIIKDYEPRFGGRMKWISEPDSGLYDAMNKGIRMSTGDVVGIINSDDFFTSPDVLESVACAMSGKDLDAVYADIHFVNPNDLTKEVRYYSSAKFTPRKMKFGYALAHPSFYCRKDCYDKYGLYRTSFSISADFELILRFAYVNRIKMQYMNKDMVTMRMGGVSTSGIKAVIEGLEQKHRAFKENDLKCSYFLLSMGIILKIIDSVLLRKKKN